MNKVYNNQTALDPGRLRFNIQFFELTTQIDEYQGQTPVETLSLTTKASRQDIVNRSFFTAYTQLEQEAGATAMNGDTYFTIRSRSDWAPKKNMKVLVNGIKYTLRAIIPLDVPLHYWRLLCTTDKIGA